MKKNFLLGAFIMVFVSCHRDDVENKINADVENKININIPVGTIVAKIDGVETTFNVYAKADTITTDDWAPGKDFDLFITGKNDSTSKSKSIRLWLESPREGKILEPGTYPMVKNGLLLWSMIHYYDIWNDDLLGYNSDTSDDLHTSTVTIVRIDSLVQGIFSGNVDLNGGANFNGEGQPPSDHKIENGMFNVRLRH